MKIESNREEMIFRSDINDRAIYSIGLSQKLQDGGWERGYMPVQFRKGTDLKNQTKIKIKEAYLKFYIKDKRTNPYIFINGFELADGFEAMKQVSDRNIQPQEKTYLEQESMDMDNLPFY